VCFYSHKLFSSNLRGAAVYLAIDTAVTNLDLEEALVSPCGAPGVSAEPVVEAGCWVVTVANHLNGVATSLTAWLVVVDTALIVEEVLIHSESSLQGTIVVQLVLNGLGWQRVNNGGGLALVLDPWLTGAGAGLSAEAGVSVAGSVWPAGLCDGTWAHKVGPDFVDIATVAAIVADIAGDGVLRSQDNILASNTESVGESLSGTESPAWTALLLVSDGVDAISGELGAVTRIEVGWETVNLGTLLSWLGVILVVHVSADEVKKLLSWMVAERVGLGVMDLPRNLTLKLIDDLVSDGMLLSSSKCGNSADNDEFEHK